MSSMNVFTDPRKRCFSEEVKPLSTEDLLKRQKEIETFMEYGVYPNWAINMSQEKFFVDYWEPYDIFRYRKALYMELLDRCKSFEIMPKIKFNF